MIENIYYMSFYVVPTKHNQEYNNVEGAYAYCWIKHTDLESAYNTAIFFIEKYDWKIEKNIRKPLEVFEEDFIEKDIGLKNFHIAQKDKMAFSYVAWSKDGKTKKDATTLESSHKFDISDYLSKQRELGNEGRCLHFQADDRCNEIIKAHSIQKNGVLSKISRKGKVYCASTSISDMRKNHGSIIFKEDGINKVSTFKGFCKGHDNKLFEPIDNSYLISENNQQIFLYAYRSIARELFVKENSLNLHIETVEKVKSYPAYYKSFSSTLKGIKNGYISLLNHKKIYDDTLKNGKYNDMRYVVFNSTEQPFVAFSGVFYPDYDFMGNLLQDLSSTSETFDLISFCSAPTDTGWSFLFAWHESSSKTCLPFMRSLATMIHEKNDLGDLLFRFLISSCENIAFSPDWWEDLSEYTQKEISKRVTNMADPYAIIHQDYLMKDLNNISKWNFKTVDHKM